MAAVGTAVDPALRALMISFADKGHNARAFTMITVSELTGTIIGGPIMSQLFSISIKLGGWFNGLCFLLSSVSWSSFRLRLYCYFSDHATGFYCCHGGCHAAIRQRLTSFGSGSGWIWYFRRMKRIYI